MGHRVSSQSRYHPLDPADDARQVYRNTDPRSKVIRKVAEDVFAVTGRNKLQETAIALHDLALKDKYVRPRLVHVGSY
jgi:hypothetical protein